MHDGAHRPRRPAPLDPIEAANIPGGVDPADRVQVAHVTAQAVVARSGDLDPEVVRRVVTLVDREGLEVVAALWADATPHSLPGALWRLYAMREWIRTDPREAAEAYALGAQRATVADAVAGVASPPGPAEVAALADAVLSGAVASDLDVALDRAAAFYRVVATGAALGADLDPAPHGEAAREVTERAARLARTATELQTAARAARAGVLE